MCSSARSGGPGRAGKSGEADAAAGAGLLPPEMPSAAALHAAAGWAQPCPLKSTSCSRSTASLTRQRAVQLPQDTTKPLPMAYLLASAHTTSKEPHLVGGELDEADRGAQRGDGLHQLARPRLVQHLRFRDRHVTSALAGASGCECASCPAPGGGWGRAAVVHSVGWLLPGSTLHATGRAWQHTPPAGCLNTHAAADIRMKRTTSYKCKLASWHIVVDQRTLLLTRPSAIQPAALVAATVTTKGRTE